MPDHLLDRLKGRLAGFRGSLQPDQPLAPIVWFRAGGLQKSWPCRLTRRILRS
jgi:hypothetical protein